MRALPGQEARLPPGPPLVDRRTIAADQRRRILIATTELIAEVGYAATATEELIRRARVGPATFYRNFQNKEECFLEVFDEELERASARVKAACEAAGEGWPNRAAAAIGALFELIAAEPMIARVCLVESQSGGPAIQERYREAVRRLAAVLEPGRALAAVEAELPEGLEDTLAGGILWTAYGRLIANEADRIPALLPETLHFALSPYLGEAGAAKVIDRLPASRGE